MTLIFKTKLQSTQEINTDNLLDNKIVEPFVNYQNLLKFFYYNVYHQRAIKLKTRVLSNIEDSNLDEFVANKQLAKDLLYNLVLNLETFGTGFLERVGASNFCLYNLNTLNARINLDYKIYQVLKNNAYKELEGFIIKYPCLSSDFYGEPDYLAVLEQIDITKKADRYNQAFFDNGARPGYGIIFENSSPNEEQIATFKEFFTDNYKGYNNAHKTLLLHTGKNSEGQNAKVRIEKLNDIADLSFEKLKSVTRDEIIASHGVPPRLVGVVASGGLGGGGELIGQLHAFNELEIKPKIQFIEDFFENIGVKLKLKKFDTTSFKDDSALATSLVQSGILSIAEARDLLDIK